jgi:hypothetical protein
VLAHVMEFTSKGSVYAVGFDSHGLRHDWKLSRLDRLVQGLANPG